MRLAIRIFLYSILSLVIALWLVLGLFKPDYLKAPLSAWIQQQTGLPAAKYVKDEATMQKEAQAAQAAQAQTNMNEQAVSAGVEAGVNQGQ